MTLDDFLKKYLGGSWGYPDNRSYKGECLSVAKLYIKECFGINPPPSGTNSAYGYWTNFPNPLGEKFEKVENTDSLIPEKGWIVIWKPWSTNQYGHIAIVADGCTAGTLKNWAQNWTSKIFQLESNRYTNVVGYLKPKSIIPSMTEEQERILDFLKGKTEGDVRQAFGALNDLQEKDKQIATLSQKVIELDTFTKKLEEKIDILSSEVQASNKIVDDWQNQAKIAKEQAGNAIAQITQANEEKNKYRRLYETQLDKSVDKMTIKEIWTLLINKIFKK